MLKLQAVSKFFGATRAVNNVSLDIGSGEMVAIIGRSGAGKSTLLRLINRLIDPSAGRVFLNDVDVSALKGRDLRLWRASSSMIFQQFNLIERMDVLTNVMLGGIARKGFLPSMIRRFSDEERAIAINALDQLDLAPQALQRAGTLSGGQQQRVAIAKALVQEPRIVLADEPIASLDPANATRVMDALKTINRDKGISVLVNLHTLDTARTYCDRIIAMRAGEVQFDGPAVALTEQRVREIYGERGLEADIDESITSTRIGGRAAGQRQVAIA